MHTQLRLWKMVDLSGHFLHFCPPVFTLFTATSVAAIAPVAAGTKYAEYYFQNIPELTHLFNSGPPNKNVPKKLLQQSHRTGISGRQQGNLRLGCHRETLGFRSKPQRRYIIWYPKVDGMVGRQYERRLVALIVARLVVMLSLYVWHQKARIRFYGKSISGD